MTEQQQSDTESVSLDQALAMAIKCHQQGQWDQAEHIYRLILHQAPNHPESLHFLGMLQHQRGDQNAAVALIEQALAQAPEYADAYNNLGNIQRFQGKSQMAATNYRKCLALDADNISAGNNLALVLKDLEQFDEAIEILTKVLAVAPEYPDFYRNLGKIHKAKGDFSAAVEAYRKALSLCEYHSEDYENLSVMLYMQGNYAEALPLIKQWLELDPDNPVARHRWASFGGEPMSRASEDYVSKLFDNFADSFDYVLKNLDYKAPFLVSAAVEKLCRQSGLRGLDILDAGCGTGLCGPLIADFAGRLVGVDLSAKMLEQAAKRDCYAQLEQHELESWIASHPATYDLIISADTLVYFGDLAGVCKAVRGALKDGGKFIFTLERANDMGGEAGYQINPHGRFSHCEAYIRSNLTAAGLSVAELSQELLRYEAGLPVNGFLVVAVGGG